jgi:hypothetical protein
MLSACAVAMRPKIGERRTTKMKKYAAIALLACVAFATLGATSSHAQVLMKAQVPFNFKAGHGTLPAGDYSIIETGMTPEAVLLRVGLRGVELVMPNNTGSQNVSTPKLVFHRYGDEYFLAEIWTNADDSVRKLAVSPRERQLAKAPSISPEVAVVYGVSSSRSGN